MTIPKNTRKAKEAIAHAHNIRCFSLSDNFQGQSLTEHPVIWGGPVVQGRFTQLIPVTQSEFLKRELGIRHAKLTGPLVHGTTGTYFIHVHSNLWYEFEA
jgi:hypothetical protein